MSNLRRLFVFSVAFLSAALAGFILGRASYLPGQIMVKPVKSSENNSSRASAISLPQVAVQSHPGEADLQKIELDVQRMAANLASDAQFDDMVDKLIEWAKMDPNAAFNFAQGHFNKERQSRVLTRMLSALAKTNPQAAWNWTLQKTPQNYQFVDTVLDEIGKTDSQAAWAYASQYAQQYPEAAHNAYFGALRGIAYAGNYATAVQLASDAGLISPDNHDGDFPAMIAGQWANYDPKQAADWLLSLPDGASRTEALTQIGSVWVQNDPAAAADFAAGLPAGETRRWVMSMAVGKWADADPVAAADWMNQQDKGADFDQVVMSIATSPQADPATAIEWANSISVKELQIQTLTKIIQIWAGKDQAAAMAFLQNSPQLSPEIRGQIQERISGQN